MTNGAVFTNAGFNAVLDKAFNSGSTTSIVSRFKIGTGTTTPAVTDTNLTTPITAWNGGSDFKNYNSTTTFDTVNQKVTVEAFVSATQANSNSITEYGDFNADASPVCFSHIVFNAITKTNTVQIFVTTTFKRVV